MQNGCQTLCWAVYSSSELAENEWWLGLWQSTWNPKESGWLIRSIPLYLINFCFEFRDSEIPQYLQEGKHLINSAVHWNDHWHFVALLNLFFDIIVIGKTFSRSIRIREARRVRISLFHQPVKLMCDEDLEITAPFHFRGKYNFIKMVVL